MRFVSTHRLGLSLGLLFVLVAPVAVRAQCTDADGDGYYYEPGCGTPQDCVDSDSAFHPGAPDIACDGIDYDCAGDEYDADLDGSCQDDCDDEKEDVHPG